MVRKRHLMSVAIIMISGCINERSKENLFSSISLCDGLYREKYIVYSGGALSAELYSDYLTDSTNFKIFIGTHDENENYSYTCSGDSIYVEKFSTENQEQIKVTENKKYNLKDLKKRHSFE